MRFDEILRASLTMPTIMGIAQYISDCKNPSKNQMHSNAGNQTRNSYTVVYIFGDNENEIRDVLIEKLSASNISCKRVGGQEIIERCHEDINVKKKYIIAFSEMASLCISINVEEEVNIPSGVTIGNVMLPSVKETFEQIWPDAVKKALEILFKQNRTEKMSMAQYQIYVSKLWSEICQKVGYMNIVDYDNFGDIKNIFYDLEKRHLIKKENDGIE